MGGQMRLIDLYHYYKDRKNKLFHNLRQKVKKEMLEDLRNKKILLDIKTAEELNNCKEFCDLEGLYMIHDPRRTNQTVQICWQEYKENKGRKTDSLPVGFIHD